MPAPHNVTPQVPRLIERRRRALRAVARGIADAEGLYPRPPRPVPAVPYGLEPPEDHGLPHGGDGTPGRSAWLDTDRDLQRREEGAA